MRNVRSSFSLDLDLSLPRAMQLAKRQAHDPTPPGIFVTGTDTGVGKTLITSALVVCLTQQGIDVGVMKPIETGVSRLLKVQSDGARLRRAAGSHDPMAEVCPYTFQLPVAPLSAARGEGRTLQTATIMRVFHNLSQKHAFMAVEGAGGVYTPITQSFNVLDLIWNVKLPSIVIGQTGLGGINHALLTLHALRQKKIPIVALVLNHCRPVHTKIARAQGQSTVSLLKLLAAVPVVGPLPYSQTVNRNWSEGVARLAKTAPIRELARLVLASILHEGSSRKRAGAKRDGHSEAYSPEAYSCSKSKG